MAKFLFSPTPQLLSMQLFLDFSVSPGAGQIEKYVNSISVVICPTLMELWDIYGRFYVFIMVHGNRNTLFAMVRSGSEKISCGNLGQNRTCDHEEKLEMHVDYKTAVEDVFFNTKETANSTPRKPAQSATQSPRDAPQSPAHKDEQGRRRRFCPRVPAQMDFGVRPVKLIWS